MTDITRPIKKQLRQAVIDYAEDTIEDLTHQALAAGLSPQNIVLECLGPGLEEVGKRYEECTYFLPELMMCGNTMKRAMAILEPLMETGGVDRRMGKVVVGTVAGDLHNLGKNMVISMLRGAGFEVHDLGVDVPIHRFVEQVRELRPDILGMSSLLLTARGNMGKIIAALKDAGLRDQVKVMVGGCAVTPKFVETIGADGYGKDAVAAVNLAYQLLGLERTGEEV